MTREIFVETDLELYAPFMKDPAGTQLKEAAQGTGLEEAVLTLAFHWRCSSYARGTPYIWAHQLGQDLRAAAAPLTPIPEEQILALLDDYVGGVVDESQRPKLLEAIRQCRRDFVTSREAYHSPTQRSVQRTWEDMLEIEQFSMGVQYNESSTFTGLVFHYEEFLGAVIWEMAGLECDSLGKFKKGLKALEAPELLGCLANQCWQDPAIARALEIRNAYAHRGGRPRENDVVSVGDRKEAYGCLILDGRVLITASDTNALYTTLLSRVLKVLERCRGIRASA